MIMVKVAKGCRWKKEAGEREEEERRERGKERERERKREKEIMKIITSHN